jgi:hypothetical protein
MKGERDLFAIFEISLCVLKCLTVILNLNYKNSPKIKQRREKEISKGLSLLPSSLRYKAAVKNYHSRLVN